MKVFTTLLHNFFEEISMKNNLIENDKFQLITKFNNNSVAIRLENDESIIIDLKKSIEMKTGLPVNKQILSFDGIILEDNKRLNDYHINNNSTIDMVSKLRGGMRIFVKTLNKKIFSFEIDESDKVSDLKREISKAIKIEYDLQQLFYNDKVLFDDKKLNDYGIINMATINIISKIRLSIETIDENTISININNNDKIIDVKYKIGKQIKIAPEEQKLFYLYFQLNDDEKRLIDYQIDDKSVITAVDKNTMKINFKIKDGDKFSMFIRKVDKVIEIKHKIENQTKLNKYLQKLIYGSREMLNNKTIDDYQISDGSEITIDVQSRYYNEAMQTFLRFPDKKLFNFHNNKLSTINNETGVIGGLYRNQYELDIKNEIMEKSNDSLRTFTNEELLTEKTSIDDKSMKKYPLESYFHDEKYEILNNEIKNLLEYRKYDQSVKNNELINNEVRKYISSLSDKTKSPIHIHESNRHKSIKDIIERRNDFNFHKNPFTYQDEILDNKKIDEYKIYDKSVVNFCYGHPRDRIDPIPISSISLSIKSLINYQSIDKQFTIKNAENRIIEKRELIKNEYKFINPFMNEKLTEKAMIGENSMQVFSAISRFSNQRNQIIDKDYKKWNKRKRNKHEILKDKDILNIKKKMKYQLERPQFTNKPFTIMDDDYKSQICSQPKIEVALTDDNIQVYFRLSYKTIFSIIVHKLDRIEDVKCKIKQKRNINKMMLTFQDKILYDNKTIDKYQISDGSVINIDDINFGCHEYPDEIYFRIPNKQLFCFNTNKLFTIGNIKSRIKQKIGLNKFEYELIYKNEKMSEIIVNEELIDKTSIDEKLLQILYLEESNIHDENYKILYDDEKYLSDYQICDQSVINIDLYPGVMQIFFKFPDGTLFQTYVHKLDRIKNIKCKITQEKCLNFSEIMLTYKYEVLNEDDKTIDEYKICDQSVIKIVDRFVLFKIKNLMFIDDVQKSDKIIDIKNKIQKKTGMHRDGQQLVYDNEILEDDKVIGKYGAISECLIIDVLINGGIELIVQTIQGNAIKITVLKTQKIGDIQNAIQYEKEINIKAQILIYQNKILEKEKTFDEYGISNKSIIWAVERNGGMEENDLKRFEIEFSRGIKTKIGDIERQIAFQIQLDCRNQAMVFHRKIFEDNKLIFFFEIKNRQQVINDENLRTFMKAIKLKQIEVVKSTFQQEYIHTKYGFNLYYPIHYACKYDCDEIIDFLIENKCDLEVTDLENKTPIHYACISGNFKTVQNMIDKHCNINAIDYLKRRPIHLACENKRKDIVDLLLKNNCEIDIYDYFNQRPLNIAKKLKQNDIINLIHNREVADSMNLSCNYNCNHKFCFKSLLDGNFDMGNNINVGISGQIYHCTESGTEQNFALKYIAKSNVPDESSIEFRINDFLLILQHDNIVKYFGSFFKNENLLIFMEYLKEYCTLSQAIEKTKTMDLDKVVDVTKKLLTGLNYLHRNNIIHRDIKPANIMLGDNENVKLIDFGESMELLNLEYEMSKNGRFCGTEDYIAPEIHFGNHYSCAMDIYGLGIIIIEMGGGNRPSINQATGNCEYNIPDSWISSGFDNIIDQMLKQKESIRATASDLLDYLNKLYYFET